MLESIVKIDFDLKNNFRDKKLGLATILHWLSFVLKIARVIRICEVLERDIDI